MNSTFSVQRDCSNTITVTRKKIKNLNLNEHTTDQFFYSLIQVHSVGFRLLSGSSAFPEHQQWYSNIWKWENTQMINTNAMQSLSTPRLVIIPGVYLQSLNCFCFAQGSCNGSWGSGKQCCMWWEKLCQQLLVMLCCFCVIERACQYWVAQNLFPECCRWCCQL